jgi:ankyrin repeat protein/archaellum biogenesis ATPase FlaH
VSTWLLGGLSLSERYYESLDRRLPGTCEWIFKRSEFSDWLSGNPQTLEQRLLWINGHAGFGKTVLCARIVEHMLSTSATPVAYFFFSAELAGSDDPYAALRSWASQLVLKSPEALELACDKWYNTIDQTTAPRHMVARLLLEMVNAIPGCVFVMDGLDECKMVKQAQPSITKFMDDLKDLVRENARVLLVSRDEPDIRQVLESIWSNGWVEIKLSAEAVRNDTIALSQHIVKQKLPKKSKEIQTSLSESMSERCDGQFLWLTMQGDSLRKGMSFKDLQNAIQETPLGLEQIYDRNWKKITAFRERDRDRAFSLLRWVAFSLRPLTIGEIAEAVLLLSDTCYDFPVDSLPDEIDDDYIDSEVLGLCGPLLEVRGPTSDTPSQRTVHLAHFTVKQYLILQIPIKTLEPNERLRKATERMHSTVLARLCLAYVRSKSSWADGEISNEYAFERRFRDYAASFWHTHFLFGEEGDLQSDTLGQVQSFMTGNELGWRFWRRWFDEKNVDDATRDGNVQEAESFIPLHYAVRLGMTKLALQMIQAIETPQGESPRITAFYFACRDGNEALVGAFLDINVDVEFPAYHTKTPLFSAATKGRSGVVEMLLNRGASVSAIDERGWTALFAAANNGHAEMARQLIVHGADVKVVDYDAKSPLWVAARGGFPKVIQVLLEHGADLSVADGGTPLIIATEEGHIETVRYILDQGVGMSKEENNGWSPLNSAALGGHQAIVQLFIERGSDVSVEDKSGSNALWLASFGGHTDIVRFLLDKGADSRALNNIGLTPLSAAAYRGHLEVVRLLLSRGADVSATTHEGGWAPLFVAAIKGHFEVAQLLLEEGADISPTYDAEGWTALMVAVLMGDTRLVRELLQRGAEKEYMHSTGWNALRLAAYKGHAEIVKLLLDHGADPSAATKSRNTPLRAAAMENHVDVVKLLLERGADVSSRLPCGGSLLHTAAEAGHEKLLQLLLKQSKLAVNLLDKAGRSPLFLAARYGRLAAVRVLLNEPDIQCTAPDCFGSTPLHAAVVNGHFAIVEVLLSSDVGSKLSEVDFGRSIHSRALHSAGARVLQLLQTRLDGFEIPATTDEVSKSVDFDPVRPWCDVCTLTIPHGKPYHTCSVCYGGVFCLCGECVDSGAKCCDASHELRANE